MRKYILFLTLILLAEAPLLAADPHQFGLEARVLGMGRAFVGLADDASAVFINPAGLAGLKTLNISNMYSTLSENVNNINLALAVPKLLDGTVGFGLDNITQAGFAVSSTETADYGLNMLVFSYARPVNDLLSLGGNIKLLSKGFSGGLLPEASGSGMDADLAFKYTPKNWLGLAVNLQNFLPTSLGGKMTLNNGAVEGIPLNIKSGISSKLIGADGMRSGNQELFVNFDFDLSSVQPTLYHLGSEWRPNELLALRAGLDQSSLLSAVFTNYTLGFGVKFNGITFDYAFYQFGDATKSVSHYFSLGYIGQEEVKLPLPAPTPEAKPAAPRKTFSDVPSAYWAKDQIELLAGLGIFPGFPEGTFQPDNALDRAEIAQIFKNLYPASTFQVTGNSTKPLSRAEGVTLIVRFLGLPPARVSEAPYADVGGRHWAAPYVTAAKEDGLLKFVGNKFEPKKDLTRAELAAIIFGTKPVQEQLKKFAP